ncbi:hypothetical protein SAMN04488490_0053 [Marinobacter sp. LV10R510-11A]|uniref:DHH family phosphoesterase n=1 Tax=Marinobacter sp. LV10R510-11A TaxID=1415568 RepID=UPI000BB97287|nr:DHH family phosphoesterase [Marinobacter sp. LV10R510-11A]SOB74568.1 hypothetical protein SAMN04488490_0053 [Marinobacter sp. LV10R510-11A]
MNVYDVFNGDADGICALIQLRLAEPAEATLITGVKRDIALARQLPTTEPVNATILDISLDKNREAVDALLAAGSTIFYVDHHFPGEAGLSAEQTESLKMLGVCINYNGYGDTVEDLHFHPADLYREFVKFADPLELIASQPPAWQKLRSGYEADMASGLAAPVLAENDSSLVVKLPYEPWARRVSGVLGNELANRNPDKACGIVTETADGSYLVSIRAPLNNRTGADEVAREFPTGGGRKAAAGINELPANQLEAFLGAMARFWN